MPAADDRSLPKVRPFRGRFPWRHQSADFFSRNLAHTRQGASAVSTLVTENNRPSFSSMPTTVLLLYCCVLLYFCRCKRHVLCNMMGGCNAVQPTNQRVTKTPTNNCMNSVFRTGSCAACWPRKVFSTAQRSVLDDRWPCRAAFSR